MSAAFDACVAQLGAQPKTWLVTGAGGFIGSTLTEALLGLGQRVIGLDNFATGKRENLEAVGRALPPERFAGFRLIEADIRDLDACKSACAGVDYVLHQAALGSVPRSIARPLDTHAVNVDGTLNVFMAALEQRVQRVVYASSSSVYGDDPGLPKTEARTGRPLSPYAASKHMGEVYASVLGMTHDLFALGLRYFNVIGPRQDPEGPYAAVVPRWLAEIARGQRPQIFGDGETSRDFCPVQNVVQANLLAALAAGDLKGRVYNVALGSRTTLNQLAEILLRGMESRGFPCKGLSPEHREFRAGDVRHSLADISAARLDLGYAPNCSLADGLAHVMDHFARAH